MIYILPENLGPHCNYKIIGEWGGATPMVSIYYVPEESEVVIYKGSIKNTFLKIPKNSKKTSAPMSILQ